MKLATAWVADGSTSLQLVAGTRFIDVGVIARQLNEPLLENLGDVGDLYRRGAAAVNALKRVSDGSGMIVASGVDRAALRLAPPVTHPASIVCIGRNYLEHIREGDAPVPAYPILFSKFPNTLVGDRDNVEHHQITSQLDYEGELAVVIGRRARRVPHEQAMEVVAGYTIVNDISGRDLQYADVQWIRGKSLDTWAPMGPVFVSVDEIPDPYALRIRTHVNGDVRQDAPVSDMLFKIPELIRFITEAITLESGDLVATGTPSGVGLGFDPPRWLQAGDVVEVSIDPIGTLTSTIVVPAS